MAVGAQAVAVSVADIGVGVVGTSAASGVAAAEGAVQRTANAVACWRRD